MKQFLKIVWMMILEEWRMHSRIYKGGSFALFPVMIFLLSAAFSYLTLNFSTLTSEVLGTGLIVVGGFFGMAAGAAGFYGRDAFRNILGRTNYIIYSSRTLPITKSKLGAAFLVKDAIYYTVLMVLPVVCGFAIFSPSILLDLPVVLLAFSTSAIFTLGLTYISSQNSFLKGVSFPVDTLTNKTLIDVLRSSGGLLKVIFSLGILTFFYWFFVLFFPVANGFLQNPLLSFAVIIGLANLSIYNWINRFDSYEDYLYLPIRYESLVNSKKKAYIVLALPLTTLTILIASRFYPENLLLALFIGYSSTVYSLVVAKNLTKLKPNLLLYKPEIFVKLMLFEGIVIVPLLVASILYSGDWFLLAAISSLVLLVTFL